MVTIWKAMAAGLAGGLVASFVMERYQAVAGPLLGQGSSDGDNATTRAADRAVAVVSAEPITEDRKPFAGQAVHYATGAVAGLAYGALTHRRPWTALGFGTVFGTLLMVLLDDAVVPLADLGPEPREVGVAAHAYSLTSHLIFGATTEGTRRLTLALLR